VKAKGADFYGDELKQRLAKGPAVFDLIAIMGKKGDPTNDPTLRWDDEDNRPTTQLGKISIEAVLPEATCETDRDVAADRRVDEAFTSTIATKSYIKCGPRV